ncbi:condensin subunit ScpA [Halohasta litchfieldiae]|jgi:segregation and condensation protein A|uniref:Condensin subunit ScpA n=1 Tax=Halohasta litchfieldiae TaxID=1073996 RepID=A0A1H6S5C9_9EURY|nr:ScpA family protein [Halohasta litchfieldiae]ATW87869.1 condensin subunit ScpA [Halohasta litchfieldiae]SEI63263.1 condensin subunit ScpA [Halohasta litchfieldiae]
MTESPEIAGLGSAPADVSPPDEVDDDDVEPVELLVQLAEDGEIDPWDIDIVDVTDAFLSKLAETDLRTSARALFYASVLLRMKGDQLLADPQEEPEPEPEPWEQAMDAAGDEEMEPGFDPVDALEDEMDRRLDRKSTRGSPETLDELVRELREAERDNWWKRRREYDTSDSPQGFSRGTQTVDYRSADEMRSEAEPTENDVTGTTHTEDIDQVIDDVIGVLQPQFDKGRAELLYTEIKTAGGRPFMTYLALLFLSHRGRIRLQQDDLFGDLWVQDPEAVEESDDDDPTVDTEPEAEPIAD